MIGNILHQLKTLSDVSFDLQVHQNHTDKSCPQSWQIIWQNDFEFTRCEDYDSHEGDEEKLDSEDEECRRKG